jgi:2,3-dihydroxybenzoate decarboxylase
MKGKIGLEEHFAIDDTLNDSKGFFPDNIWVEVRERILDLHGRRLRLMDEFGMEMMILSLNAPAIQAIPDSKKANEIARKANDYLAEQVRKRPDRFQALAALPLQDPDMATEELQRCVKDLGMVGALANGFSQVGDLNTIAYLDEKQYWPFWQVCEQLDVPFYLHPRNPLPQDARIYKDHGWLMGPTWAFGHETAVHALRLMGSGLFDKHPKLQIMLGHMGERLDSEPAPLSGQDKNRRLLPGQLPHHRVRQLPFAGAAQRPDGDGLRPHHVLDRLAVRKHRSCRIVVRRRADRRG